MIPGANLSRRPRQHADPEFLRAKQARSAEAHVAPLNALAARIEREAGRRVPFVDPDSGGVDARVLILLEAPSRAAAHRSGMVSADNDDATAANLWRAYDESGLPREISLIWNVVPWYVGTPEKLAPVQAADVRAGAGWLQEFLRLLPELDAVLALGATAQRGLTSLALRPALSHLRTLAAPHPSQRVYNRPGARARERVHAAFARASS